HPKIARNLDSEIASLGATRRIRRFCYRIPEAKQGSGESVQAVLNSDSNIFCRMRHGRSRKNGDGQKGRRGTFIPQTSIHKIPPLNKFGRILAPRDEVCVIGVFSLLEESSSAHVNHRRSTERR